MQVVTLNYQQMDGLNTVMPSGTIRIKTNRTLTTESLSTFMPFKVQEVQDSNGIYYGQNVISKNMILIDRKKLQNGNSFILGVSGSGKSFTAKQEITSIALRDKNADIIILDPEAEYRPLVESLGGQVVKISSTSSNHINALELNKNYGYDDEDEKREKDPIVAKSEFMLSLCMQIMQEQNVNPYKKTIIDRCSKLVYEDYKNRNYKGEPPTLNDFREILLQQKEKEAKEIALALELFTKGSLNTFASQTNIEINNRILCYDINSLGDNLRPVGMLVLLDNILNRISLNRQKGKSTYIFIDEIYLLFRYSYTAEFIEKLWKRIRKYGGFATGITQNIQEVLASSTASIMLSNRELLIMLNQSAIDGDLLAENLKLSDMEKSYITNVSSGEGLIKVKNSFIPFKNKFPKDTELYKLMTTKLSDLKNNN